MLIMGCQEICGSCFAPQRPLMSQLPTSFNFMDSFQDIHSVTLESGFNIAAYFPAN